MHPITHPNGVVTYAFDNLTPLPVAAHISTRRGSALDAAESGEASDGLRRGDSGGDSTKQDLTNESGMLCQHIH